MYFDFYYLVLVVPALLLSLWAQIKVKSTFAKYSRVRISRNMTGRDAAELLLRANNITGVRIEPVEGSLTEQNDPASKVLRLSRPVYGEHSIAAIGVAAHETGHALQDAFSWGPLVLRGTLVPVANIGSSAGPVLAVAGIFLSLPVLINIGIILFGAAVAFYLVTLPVEFNASARAIRILRSGGLLDDAELRGVRRVLSAAALTYVASALTALMSLLRLVLLSRSRRR